MFVVGGAVVVVVVVVAAAAAAVVVVVVVVAVRVSSQSCKSKFSTNLRIEFQFFTTFKIAVILAFATFIR